MTGFLETKILGWIATKARKRIKNLWSHHQYVSKIEYESSDAWSPTRLCIHIVRLCPRNTTTDTGLKHVGSCALHFTNSILSAPPKFSMRWVQCRNWGPTHPRSQPMTDRRYQVIQESAGWLCHLSLALNRLIKNDRFANLVRYYFVSCFHLHADC